MNRLIFNLPVLLAFSFVLFSCGAPQRLVYFRDDVKSEPNVETMPIKEIEVEGTIRKDDILAINITSISSVTENNPVGIFKEGGTNFSVSSGASSSQTSGYLVDKDGLIDFPVVGKIEVGGKTIREAKETIALRLKDYIKEPVVEVRILNYKITMLGDIARPGTLIAANHKINIIEAIASSGDIPVTGKRENVLVIRDNNGKKEFARLNLNSKDVFNSPYFYLKQNDIVYVEPSKVKRQEANTFTRVYVPLITSVLSLLVTGYALYEVSNRNK